MISQGGAAKKRRWNGLRGRSSICAEVATLAVALCRPAPAFGQVQSPPPRDEAAQLNGDQVRLQRDRERAQREQFEREPDVRRPSPAASTALLPITESPCFPVRAIALEGDASARFIWALSAAYREADPPADEKSARCLGTEGINLILSRVQDAIVARGWVTTRVLVAPQDLRSGTLTLTLVPGRLHSLSFAAGSDPRATVWNALPLSPGELLNLRDIEQGLENFKRVPTAEADIQIVPAEGAAAQPGQSDLLIRWTQGRPFRFNFSLDDAGSEATGRVQGGVTLSYDNPLALNDLFYLNYTRNVVALDAGAASDKGTHSLAAHYSLPFGYWLLSLNANHSSYYQAVAGANQTYVYSGTSDGGEAKLARVIYRDAQARTTLAMAAWLRGSDNSIDDTEVRPQRRRTGGWTASLAQRQFIGAATLDGTLSYKRGTGAFGAIAAPEEAFGEGTSRMRLILADAELSAPFELGEQALRYSGSWRAQWSRTPLVPQDRFGIGGRYTVRGFDGEQSLVAEHGWLLRNELAGALGASGQEAYAGIDHGEVGGRGIESLRGARLTGAVIGLRGGVAAWQYDVFAGCPLRKPEGFRTAGVSAGFTLNLSF